MHPAQKHQQTAKSAQTLTVATHSQLEQVLTGIEQVLTGNDKGMATLEGLQPPTSALGKPCSMQLSYRATGVGPSESAAKGEGIGP